MRLITFKKGLIIFWFLWWLIALWTDIAGGLAHLGYLNAPWAVDNNYPFLASSLSMYAVSEWIIVLLFIGIIVWSAISMSLYFWACLALRQPKTIWLYRAQIAFMVSLFFWLAFFLADQVVMKYDLEENHMVQGGFQFLSFLALYILPEE